MKMPKLSYGLQNIIYTVRLGDLFVEEGLNLRLE